ncbi:hypothetical protein [Neorhizobium sp. JUb45]|uniref:hypothetical protein n=1 Tax=Neorhizobium sp. JUb45 TaxID=2485113 RepID=UPI0010530A55|nr:hypothetical protein [Neorhizobium sp. JUb45]TCR04979.1 hypothetical protein EDF70_1021095 [Neorhizobium sp. JUb45]
MLEINSGRIQNPKTLIPDEIARECEKRGKLVVQFSTSDSYPTDILLALNEACRIAKDHLQVRFYGHYGTFFDAKVVRHLPEARDLAVDCLRIENEDEIGHLTNLISLNFGVFELDRPDFLKTLRLGQLEKLGLIENRKRNFDLSPLAECKSLQSLFVNGHSKNIDVLVGLQQLRKLSLGAYAKKNRLDFLNGMTSLKDLTLILGGRSDINDLMSETLEILQILRVQGVETLGDLSRMPALAALRVEDQIKLRHLDLTGAKLQRLALFNCKNLTELSGLDMQGDIEEFAVSRTALDLDKLRDRDWPVSARSVRLFSGSRKWNDAAEAQMSARNLNQKPDYWF